MIHYSKWILVKISCLFSVYVQAQSGYDSSADIEVSQNREFPNVYTFSVVNEPPLQQIAGAPQANYTYFWEFGDGDYSVEKNPTHIYADSTGRGKKVVVSLTNNYGSGGAPRLRPRKIIPENKKPVPEAMHRMDDRDDFPLSQKETIHLFTNHSPRPGDPMVCVLSYQNTDELLPENGSIYLFYNEKEYNYSNFVFEETRTHHSEIFYDGLKQEVFSLNDDSNTSDENIWASVENSVTGQFSINPEVKIPTVPFRTFQPPSSTHKAPTEGKRIFKNAISWEYSELKPGEKRNIFTTFLCSSEMIIDTSKTISIRAVIVPENKDKTREYNLKMVIQSSHDPNKLFVSDRKIKKRLIRKNGIDYMVKFQNMGKGPARNIQVINDLHPSLDPSTIQLIDHYPDASLCLERDSSSSCLDSITTGQQIKWMFNNVYLPGTRQDDKENRKATKGWIEFSIRPKKHFKRKDIIDARSLIYFDRNEPITTNQVRTKVEKNWSYGTKAGFAETPFSFEYMMLGASFASFRPKSFYLQPEIMVSSLSQEGISRSITNDFIPTPDGTVALGDETVQQDFQLLYLDIVPLQVRKNITPFASVGAGLHVSWLLKANEIFTTDRTYYPTRGSNFEPPYPPYSERESATVYNPFKGLKDDRFSSIEMGFFIDVQGGLVNKGPSLGLRYQTRNGKRPVDEDSGERQSNNVFQVYVQMRF